MDIELIKKCLDSIDDVTERMTSGNFMHNKAEVRMYVQAIRQEIEK